MCIMCVYYIHRGCTNEPSHIKGTHLMSESTRKKVTHRKNESTKLIATRL